jgi:hypothetical protein
MAWRPWADAHARQLHHPKLQTVYAPANFSYERMMPVFRRLSPHYNSGASAPPPAAAARRNASLRARASARGTARQTNAAAATASVAKCTEPAATKRDSRRTFYSEVSSLRCMRWLKGEAFRELSADMEQSLFLSESTRKC